MGVEVAGSPGARPQAAQRQDMRHEGSSSARSLPDILPFLVLMSRVPSG